MRSEWSHRLPVNNTTLRMLVDRGQVSDMSCYAAVKSLDLRLGCVAGFGLSNLRSESPRGPSVMNR